MLVRFRVLGLWACEGNKLGDKVGGFDNFAATCS